MAVYTILHHNEISALLHRFDLAELVSFEGAGSGIENSTYFLTLADDRHYVLTVFEQFSAQQLTPYVDLMTLLHAKNLAVPCPLLDRSGSTVQTIAGKPALLFERAPGHHLQAVDLNSCHSIGEFLGSMHAITAAISPKQLPLDNPCGLPWMKETYAFVAPSLITSDQQLLQEQIALSETLEQLPLPRGIIHGDLFRDNALFDQQKISAVIDFYNAGRELLLLDLAITANDWCFIGSASQPVMIDALLESYQRRRPFNPEEKSAWPTCLQVAAARFWLSRQKRVVLAASGSTGLTKIPPNTGVCCLSISVTGLSNNNYYHLCVTVPQPTSRVSRATH